MMIYPCWKCGQMPGMTPRMCHCQPESISQREVDKHVADLNRRTNWWMVRLGAAVLLGGGLMLHTVSNIIAMNRALIECQQGIKE